MKKSLLLLPILTIFIIMVGSANAASNITTTPIPQVRRQSDIRLTLYSPSMINLQFAYTRNVTISNVTTIGLSLYEIVQSPIELRFTVSDLDEYFFILRLTYEGTVSQVIRIIYYSGSQNPSSIEIPVDAGEVTLRVRVVCSKEPKYPTPDEVASAVVIQISSRLDQYHSELQQILGVILANLNTQSMAMFILLAAILIISGVLFTITTRRRNRQPDKSDEEET